MFARNVSYIEKIRGIVHWYEVAQSCGIASTTAEGSNGRPCREGVLGKMDMYVCNRLWCRRAAAPPAALLLQLAYWVDS